MLLAKGSATKELNILKIVAATLLNLLNELGEEVKCEDCRVFYLFFATSLTNSIIQEHEFKI